MNILNTFPIPIHPSDPRPAGTQVVVRLYEQGHAQHEFISADNPRWRNIAKAVRREVEIPDDHEFTGVDLQQRPIRFFENLLITHGVDCLNRVHGRTRWDSVGGYEADRVSQIREYVVEHGVECFVVLDDLDLQMENFVRTDGNIGLTDADVERAIAVLCQPMVEGVGDGGAVRSRKGFAW